MPTVTVKDGGNTLSGYNFTAGGSGQSWTVQSDSGTNDAVSISKSGPVNISSSSRTPGQSFTITPQSSTGNYTVSLSQSVTSGGGKGGGSSTTVYTAQIQGNVASAPTPSYSLGTVSNMNEGANQTISVTTSNVSNGTTLYFSIDGSGDFTSHSGSFTISGNSGSFTISSIGDQTTEGNETKTLRLRTGSTSGTQVDSATFTLIDTSTASGGGGSGGAGTGGSTTGTATYGLAVNGPNGSTVVFGTNLRTQNAVFSTTLSAASGTTYGPFSVANANNTSKIQITADYQVPPNSSNTVQGSQIILTKSSTGFTFRHTAGGTKTFVLTAIQIG